MLLCIVLFGAFVRLNGSCVSNSIDEIARRLPLRFLVISYLAVESACRRLPELKAAQGGRGDAASAGAEDRMLSYDAKQQVLQAVAPSLPEVERDYGEIAARAGSAVDKQVFAGCSEELQIRMGHFQRKLIAADEAAAALRMKVERCLSAYEAIVGVLNDRFVAYEHALARVERDESGSQHSVKE